MFGILEVWILCRLANCSFEAHGKAFGGFGGFGEFWRVCGLANGSFESLRKPLLWPGPGVPVGEVALALGCMLGKVFGILEVWILCRLANGSFEAHRKSLLWI